MTGGWHAGYNLAGYLPESEPVHVDTLADGVEYLRGEVDRWLDDDAVAGEEWTRDLPSDDPADYVGADGDGWYRDTHLWVVPCETPAECAAETDGAL